jgi:hypothetical protein
MINTDKKRIICMQSLIIHKMSVKWETAIAYFIKIKTWKLCLKSLKYPPLKVQTYNLTTRISSVHAQTHGAIPLNHCYNTGSSERLQRLKKIHEILEDIVVFWAWCIVPFEARTLEIWHCVHFLSCPSISGGLYDCMTVWLHPCIARARILKHLLEAEKLTVQGFQRSERTAGLT